ncbi:MAG: 3-phosphoshikimate 1-carboxyvinyltransferase [Actinobacteria bacterium RBG_16_68_21]|nr:MAG: 3-phosphoshikimate 1-carboxyvinyltransferase [Actinobacteria bacterium RBG_16_68_21]
MIRFHGPQRPFHADLTVPGDKSLSHRALILAAMAAGRSMIEGRGTGADIASTCRLLEQLGASVEPEAVESPGVVEWSPPSVPLDAGNSGTTIRLLTGALAARPFRSTLIGDASLMSRPMQRLVGPLGKLGARVSVSTAGTPPVIVDGTPLYGAPVRVPMASAQVRTAVALAALQADGSTVVDSPPGFRDHTERWLTHLGLGSSLDETRFRIDPGPIPSFRVTLPGDTSSASFLWAAAALGPGSTVRVRSVSLNPGRTGFLDVLAAMGAEVEIVPTAAVLGDPVGDVTVTGNRLTGTIIEGELTVRTLDELPLVAVVAAFAAGATTVRDAAELRTKESDRIAATVGMIRALGGAAEPAASGLVVEGTGLTGGVVAADGDHRIAMAAAVAATRSGSVVVEGFEVAAVSWPEFEAVLEETWSSP